MILAGCRIKITGESVVRNSFDSTIGFAGKEIDFADVLVPSSMVGFALGIRGAPLGKHMTLAAKICGSIT